MLIKTSEKKTNIPLGKPANQNLEKGPVLRGFQRLYTRHWSKRAIALIDSQIRELRNGDFPSGRGQRIPLVTPRGTGNEVMLITGPELSGTTFPVKQRKIIIYVLHCFKYDL